MSRALDLMKECNQVLLRLHDLNKQQISSLTNGDFNGLDLFADKRQAVLEMLDVLEEQLDGKLKSLEESDKSNMHKEIKLRKEVLQGVLEQEFKLHQLLEKEKTKVALEITHNKKNHKAVSSYKSKQDHSKPLKEV